MADERSDLEGLTQEIKKNIESNKKFLQRVFDEDFDAEDEPDEEKEVLMEL